MTCGNMDIVASMALFTVEGICRRWSAKSPTGLSPQDLEAADLPGGDRLSLVRKGDVHRVPGRAIRRAYVRAESLCAKAPFNVIVQEDYRLPPMKPRTGVTGLCSVRIRPKPLSAVGDALSQPVCHPGDRHHGEQRKTTTKRWSLMWSHQRWKRQDRGAI